MTGGDHLKGRLEIREWLHAIDFRGGDLGGDAGPGAAALVVPGEECVLSRQTQFPFILPMSGRFAGFIINGMPILART